MIDSEHLAALVSQYERHGWRLRRIVAAEDVGPSARTLPDIEVKRGSIDAAWFSRPGENGRISWELRLLAAAPYALVISAEPGVDIGEDFDDAERRMRDAIARFPRDN